MSTRSISNVTFLQDLEHQATDDWGHPIAPLPATTYNAHANEHWSFCTDPYCAIHLSSKKNNNYDPMRGSSQRNRRSQSCDCKTKHDLELEAVIKDKNLNRGQACRGWKKGKRVCPDCRYLVNLSNHEERCSAHRGTSILLETRQPTEEPTIAIEETVVHEDNKENIDPHEIRTTEAQLRDIVAQATAAQEVATVSITAAHQVIQEGRERLTAALNRQDANTTRLARMVEEVQQLTHQQRTLAAQLNQQRRRQRPFRVVRHTRPDVVGASIWKGGLMSRTTHDMLIGASLATAGLWIVGMTAVTGCLALSK